MIRQNLENRKGLDHKIAHLWFMEATTSTLINIWLYQSIRHAQTLVLYGVYIGCQTLYMHFLAREVLSWGKHPANCVYSQLSTILLHNPSDSGECEHALCYSDLVQYIYIYMLQVRINLCIFVLVSEFETLTHTHDVHKQWQWDIWYPKWFPISSHSKYPYPFKFTNILQYVHPNLEANQPK